MADERVERLAVAPVALGSYLRERRQDMGLTLAEVAARVRTDGGRQSISIAYLCDIEQGRRTPQNPDTLTALAYALGAGEDVVFALAGRLPPDVAEEARRQGLTAVARCVAGARRALARLDAEEPTR